MLQNCGLLGKDEFTDDDYYPKYFNWIEVPILERITLPRALRIDFEVGADKSELAGGKVEVEAIEA